MKNKKGSHVGMIASFSIFILFLIAIYFIIQPTVKNQKDKQLILDYLKLKIQEQLSANLTTLVISNSSTNPASCIFFNKSDSGLNNGNFYVKDKNSNTLEFGNGVNPDYLDIEWNGQQTFVKIFSSEEKFNAGSFSCGATAGVSNYTVKSIVKEKQFFETKIANGITNFLDLKNNVTVTQGNDWNMDFEYSNGTTISTGTTDTLREVYSEEIPIVYVDKNASLLPGKLRIKVW
ncbi:MAG: hypothetical protein AABW51_02780 [Nanoarchaeota archaeon]